MTFRSDATEGVWSPTQNVAVQTEANVVAIFFFHQCGFYDPTHHIRGCQKIIWNFALKGRALAFKTRYLASIIIKLSVYINILVKYFQMPFILTGTRRSALAPERNSVWIIFSIFNWPGTVDGLVDGLVDGI